LLILVNLTIIFYTLFLQVLASLLLLLKRLQPLHSEHLRGKLIIVLHLGHLKKDSFLISMPQLLHFTI